MWQIYWSFFPSCPFFNTCYSSVRLVLENLQFLLFAKISLALSADFKMKMKNYERFYPHSRAKEKSTG